MQCFSTWEERPPQVLQEVCRELGWKLYDANGWIISYICWRGKAQLHSVEMKCMWTDNLEMCCSCTMNARVHRGEKMIMHELHNLA